MVAAEHKKDMEDMDDKDRQEARDIYLTTAFLLGCDHAQYGKLMENMENDYLQGCSTYPKTLAAAFNLLVNWKQDLRNLLCSVGVTKDSVSFTTIESGWEDENAEGVTMATSESSTKQGKKGGKNKRRKERDISKYKCGHCGEYGHYPTHCDGTRLAQSAKVE